MRLLIVEDEQTLLQQLAEQFRNEGFVVDTAADGDTGLYLAREYPLDLAVVDLGLPGRSGLELLRTIRSEGNRLPVLVLTARDGRWNVSTAVFATTWPVPAAVASAWANGHHCAPSRNGCSGRFRGSAAPCRRWNWTAAIRWSFPAPRTS